MGMSASNWSSEVDSVIVSYSKLNSEDRKIMIFISFIVVI